MYDVEHWLPVQNRLGEGPRWHPIEGCLYWVDIDGGAVCRYRPQHGAVERFAVGYTVGALGFRAGGGLVLASGAGFAFWDAGTPGLELLGNPEAGRADARFNDGAVDRQGRFWAGTKGGDARSGLYRLDPDRTIRRMETGVTIANGLGWSPDDRQMYFTDSPARTIYIYDYQPDTGTLANRRPFVSTPDEPGVPDGLAVDSAGCLWSARWDGWKITRYSPDGRVLREVALPVARVTSCAFGGPGLDELYITSAWTELSPADRAAQPLAGDLFRLRVEVPGLPESLFRG